MATWPRHGQLSPYVDSIDSMFNVLEGDISYTNHRFNPRFTQPIARQKQSRTTHRPIPFENLSDQIENKTKYVAHKFTSSNSIADLIESTRRKNKTTIGNTTREWLLYPGNEWIWFLAGINPPDVNSGEYQLKYRGNQLPSGGYKSSPEGSKSPSKVYSRPFGGYRQHLGARQPFSGEYQPYTGGYRQYTGEYKHSTAGFQPQAGGHRPHSREYQTPSGRHQAPSDRNLTLGGYKESGEWVLSPMNQWVWLPAGVEPPDVDSGRHSFSKGYETPSTGLRPPTGGYNIPSRGNHSSRRLYRLQRGGQQPASEGYVTSNLEAYSSDVFSNFLASVENFNATGVADFTPFRYTGLQMPNKNISKSHYHPSILKTSRASSRVSAQGKRVRFAPGI